MGRRCLSAGKPRGLQAGCELAPVLGAAAGSLPRTTVATWPHPHRLEPHSPGGMLPVTPAELPALSHRRRYLYPARASSCEPPNDGVGLRHLPTRLLGPCARPAGGPPVGHPGFVPNAASDAPS
eukprot:7741201-Pyramimonas_sp.AAC.1